MFVKAKRRGELEVALVAAGLIAEVAVVLVKPLCQVVAQSVRVKSQNPKVVEPVPQSVAPQAR
jgi:hypothetical protein